MNRKNKGKRANVAVLRTSHERLIQLSDSTGISLVKLVDMAIGNLLKHPPTVRIPVLRAQDEE